MVDAPCWTPSIPSSSTCWDGTSSTCNEEIAPVAVPVVHGITLNSFGLTPIVNSSASALRQDSEWYVPLSIFGPTLTVRLTAIAGIVATDTAAEVSLWASATEGDISGSGLLLARLSIPLAGDGGVFTGFSTVATVSNPGTTVYVGVTSKAGKLAGVAKTLSYYGLFAQIEDSAT